jgi:hypothetical protein
MAHDNIRRSTTDDDERRLLLDDAAWHPLPHFLPSIEKLRGRFKREALKMGLKRPSRREYELYRLRLVRTFQWHYGNLVHHLIEADRANGTNLHDSLHEIVVGASEMGQAVSPFEEEQTQKATEASLEARKKQQPSAWRKVVDKRLPELKEETHLSNTAKARIVIADLKKQKIKPPAMSTLRQHIGDKQRT